ncbi:serine threonine protein phosphatase [Pyrenophora tritici-repentis]|uniref:Serine/threonine protein phosphatase n=2 Tax=Pyrenophora tritici-repentis TaxID=45151 RepID=A0A2W1GFF5_9PLEO|nr:serine/threonine protein phosphatase [Pyrenophora tritici-repentis Pt-1C-BFP]KAA8617660.1 Serine/threonine protein phosphatase [Pyrenophora tritici-repentis]EDU42528.1 serine/threonine protein phosphatase [Pyrenophora tritici-repentis Pt-1C-BFP]KAF7443415.1 Serine/threonine protein phosphatase [Pyrenophora tritici-repentis]KAG9376903.1 Serine/threonine protein phosphatase [Pyrenophora tritici-repentis]KAI0572632.1 Serine/threonine protein phosphatase [Pyrenophora tritici-repentis]
MSSTPMTYRDQPQQPAYAQNRPRPLIEQIPDYRDDLDVSDEEDAFYRRDDDFLIPPKLQAAITRTSDRIPRRIKRHSLTYLVIFILFLISWWTHFGPRRAAQKAELFLMDNKPTMSYGNNVRPEFKGMIQVSDMDEQHLPKHNNRLIFIGDVHGCKQELEHLLKKVDFNSKHDHVVLVGDMIAKGPDSAGVIKVAQKVGASCVRGNWEDKLLLSIAEAQDRHMLVMPEDEDATISFLDDADHESATASAHANPALRRLAKQFSKKQISYLSHCPVILRVGQIPIPSKHHSTSTSSSSTTTLVAVHAGLVPDTPLEDQDPFHVMNMRSIDLKTRIPSSKHGGTPWEKFWNHRQEKMKHGETTTVVYGHNRKKGLNLHEYSWGLDTGCASGGKLTAAVVDGKGERRIVHVKCGKEGGYEE